MTKFVGVCLEPLEWLTLPKAYDESSPLAYLTKSRLGALVDNAMSLVKNSQTAAAFQLAVLVAGAWGRTGRRTAGNKAEERGGEDRTHNHMAEPTGL